MVRKQVRGAKGQSNGTLDRWNTYDDIPDDSQNAFHRQQDRIALGDLQDDAVNEVDEYGALGGSRGVLDIDEQSLESDAEDLAEDDEDEGIEEEDNESEEDDYPTTKATTKKAKALSSEEEDDDDDEDDKDPDDAPSGGWGPNKQSYYSTNDLDDLSSDSEMDEEERRELEIKEVKRLQAKSRQGLTDEDFGLGQDTLRLEGSTAAREARRKDFEAEATSMAKATTTESLDIASLDAFQRAQLVSKVQKATPETLALVGEYADIIEEIAHVSKRLKKVMQSDTREEIVGLCGLHHQVLLTYAANLAFYFHLRASTGYASNPRKLATHRVIDRLAKLKNGLQVLDGFGFAADEDDDAELSDEGSESIEGDEDEENRDPSAGFLFQPNLLGEVDEDDDMSLGSLEEDELKQLDREEQESEAAAAKSKRPNKQERTDKAAEKKKEKKPKAKKVAAPLAQVAQIQDEDDSLGASRKRKKIPNKSAAAAALTTDAEAFSAFGEPTQLSASDSADKEARRKSLKFYTGQIDAKEARKAGGSGLGGDSDIPYRDRERSRMAVADANARKTASFSRQADRRLDGDEWGEEDSRDWKDVMDVQRSDPRKVAGEDDDDADYYDLVASGKKSLKRAKKDEYDDLKASQRVAPDNSLEDGEHRGISRTIEKNRGLTPRRPKANRNPRVKKRIRFEKAQKKLSSKGPVYKGGQGALQGGYSGEQSGINSNVVKSRQFA